MFVALDSSGFIIQQRNLKKFSMNKESMVFPNKIEVFMYLTSSIQIRNPLSFTNLDEYFRTHGEISYWPFGFHISIDTPPINRPYLSITYFKELEYNKEANLKLPLRYLEPEGHMPGFYRN